MDDFRRRPPMEGFSRPGSLGGEAFDDDEVEGHIMGDRDRDEIGGESWRRRLDDDDTEGHGVTAKRASDDDDTEGHGITAKRASDDDDTEGHGVTAKRLTDEEDDAEGHVYNLRR